MAITCGPSIEASKTSRRRAPRQISQKGGRPHLNAPLLLPLPLLLLPLLEGALDSNPKKSKAPRPWPPPPFFHAPSKRRRPRYFSTPPPILSPGQPPAPTKPPKTGAGRIQNTRPAIQRRAAADGCAAACRPALVRGHRRRRRVDDRTIVLRCHGCRRPPPISCASRRQPPGRPPAPDPLAPKAAASDPPGPASGKGQRGGKRHVHGGVAKEQSKATATRACSPGRRRFFRLPTTSVLETCEGHTHTRRPRNANRSRRRLREWDWQAHTHKDKGCTKSTQDKEKKGRKHRKRSRRRRSDGGERRGRPGFECSMAVVPLFSRPIGYAWYERMEKQALVGGACVWISISIACDSNADRVNRTQDEQGIGDRLAFALRTFLLRGFCVRIKCFDPPHGPNDSAICPAEEPRPTGRSIDRSID